MSTFSAPLRFPYMFWAHGEAVRSPYCLSQSGMPAPDAAMLGDVPLDVAPPPIEALPAVETRLAELFGVERERVLVTQGASGAMMLAAQRFFPHARVVTELPSYEPFRALPRLFGGELAVVRRDPRAGWRLSADDVARALADLSRPGHLFLCTPHNPTGAVLAAEELVVLADLARRAGGVLVSNEIYMEFASPAERVHAFRLAPNALSIGSLTKAYGLGALRIGWMILGDDLVGEREHLVDLAYLGWVDPPTPALRAAQAALGRLEALLQPLRRLESESRPHLERWLAESPRVDGRLGPFGLSAFPRVLGVHDTRALGRHLAEKHGVDVVPGEFFGLEGHVRVGFAVPEATLVEGLERLERGIAAF